MAKRRMGIMAFLLSLFLCFMPCLALAVSTTEAKEHIDINKEVRNRSINQTLRSFPVQRRTQPPALFAQPHFRG